MPDARLQRTRDAYTEPLWRTFPEILLDDILTFTDTYEIRTDPVTGVTTRERIPARFEPR
jgi:hypothetical protein